MLVRIVITYRPPAAVGVTLVTRVNLMILHSFHESKMSTFVPAHCDCSPRISLYIILML